MSIKKKIVVCVAAVSVLTLGIAHISFASIPDSGGTIHGCRLNLTGVVRIIDTPSQSCIIGETALNWSGLTTLHLVTGGSDAFTTNSSGIVTDGHADALTATCPSGEMASQGILVANGGVETVFSAPRQDGTAVGINGWSSDVGVGITPGMDVGVPNVNGVVTLKVVCLPVPGL